MSEHQRKSCKVHFENSEKEISIKLSYSKRDKDVDIRDFFSNAMKKFSDLEVHFKKGHYELMSKGQQHVLEMVPDVIKIFQTFYKGSFGESDDHTDASDSASVPRVGEQKRSEGQVMSANNGQQKEEQTARESNDETTTGLQNSGNGSMADIKETGATQESEHHNGSKKEQKNPSITEIKTPGGDAEHVEKRKENSDSNGMQKKIFNNDGEQGKEDKSEYHDVLKQEQKNPSTTENKTPEGDAEHDEKQKNRKASQDDETCDEARARESNNEKTVNPPGSKGHDASKGAKRTDSNTTNNMMHENDEHDGDKNRQRRSAADAKVNSRDASKEHEQSGNAEEESKRNHNDSEAFV